MGVWWSGQGRTHGEGHHPPRREGLTRHLDLGPAASRTKISASLPFKPHRWDSVTVAELTEPEGKSLGGSSTRWARGLGCLAGHTHANTASAHRHTHANLHTCIHLPSSGQQKTRETILVGVIPAKPLPFSAHKARVTVSLASLREIVWSHVRRSGFSSSWS